MFDKELMFRAAAAGDLTADMAVAYLNTGAPQNGLLTVRIVVPSIAEANDTIVPILHLSVDGAGNGEVIITGETITKAGVDAGNQQYFMAVPRSPYKYVGLELDITDADAGGDFNAGVVLAGLVPAGQYQDR